MGDEPIFSQIRQDLYRTEENILQVKEETGSAEVRPVSNRFACHAEIVGNERVMLLLARFSDFRRHYTNG